MIISWRSCVRFTAKDTRRQRGREGGREGGRELGREGRTRRGGGWFVPCSSYSSFRYPGAFQLHIHQNKLFSIACFTQLRIVERDEPSFDHFICAIWSCQSKWLTFRCCQSNWMTFEDVWGPRSPWYMAAAAAYCRNPKWRLLQRCTDHFTHILSPSNSFVTAIRCKISLNFAINAVQSRWHLF